MFRGKTTYITFAITCFLLCIALLQTLQFGVERIPLKLIFYGENLDEVKVNYSNNITTSTSLDTLSCSSNVCIFNVPEYAFTRYLNISLNYSDSLEIHKIEIHGNKNYITIKPRDFPNYLRYKQFTYNTKNNRFYPTSDFDNNQTKRLDIRTIDLSNLIIDLYIKRIPQKTILLISIVITLILTILLYFISLKSEELKTASMIIVAIIIATSSIFSYIKFNQKNTIKENLYEADIFDIIKPHTPNNLIYNGDFKYGLMFWGYDSDSTTHQLVDTPYGKGVKITRGDGDGGYWSLRYYGKPITYHKNKTYVINFKYKIIKSVYKKVFNVGWWINRQNNEYRKVYDLNYKTKQLGNGWIYLEAYYRFSEDQHNLICLLNSLKDNSEIIITDVGIYEKI